jgi:DNA-3-methyladenine glycosylase II
MCSAVSADGGIARATRAIARRDPVMAAFIKRAGPCVLREPMEDNFTSIARAILYQQLAGKAAAAIYGRFAERLGGRLTPEGIAALPETEMRAAGLSRSKAAAVADLSAKVLDGTVPLDDVDGLGDDEIVARLTTVRGIGRWTAEMFLLFQLRRPDVWPVDDYGVRTGWKLIYGHADLLPPKALMAEGERFRPYRSVAAWYCWEAVHLARA